MSDGVFRTLLLEDDPAVLARITGLLGRITSPRLEVATVGCLSDALSVLAQDSPCGFDLILVGVDRPGEGEDDILAMLAAAAPGAAIVVLSESSCDGTGAVARVAQDVLLKTGLDPALLARVLRHALDRKAGEAALRGALAAADQAERAKSVFLATMGHEIRTPLNGVLGMTRLLRETPLDPRQSAYVEALERSAEVLLGLINDVLDFAQMERGAAGPDSVEFDLMAEIEAVRQVWTGCARDKGLVLTCHLEPGVARWVRGDRLRLRRILLNLLGNAVKFTDRGMVGLTVERLGGGPEANLRFTVKDSGIGIAPEIGRALFAEFWQADTSPARRFSGTGLGLAICKRLCDLMGGEISYDSIVGQGSVFRVVLPFPEVGMTGAAPPPEGDRPVPAQTVRLRILLVDDNEVNRAAAADLLERRGHTVVTAEDGAAAVEAAAGEAFDLILLDMRMPAMDGVETAEAIRSGSAAAVPIFLLTATFVAEDEARWRRAGIGGCLIKPLRIEDLARALALPIAASSQEPSAALVALDDLRMDLHDLGADRMAGLVDLFRRSSGADLARLVALAGEGRVAEAGAMAHRMAGAAASLHLHLLSSLCREIDSAARNQNGDAVVILVDGVTPLWHRSFEALVQAMARATGAGD